MTTMLAARLIIPGEPLQIMEMPVPEPGSGEILLQVQACGLCGTDLHLGVHGDLPVERLPITLGHEAAGFVSAVGKGVGNLKEGDRVALFPAASCGRCRFCLAGREALCDASKVYGMNRDGALAQFMVAPVRTVIPLPDQIPFAVGAMSTDGVATPFHALRSRGNLQAGESVGVFGCGGLGTHAILLAKLLEASPIIAVDIDPLARERALESGAHLAIDPGTEDVAKSIRRHLGGDGLDLALEFVGLKETVELALRSIGKGGRAVLVGVGMDRASLPPLVSFVSREHTILGSFGMDRQDIEDVFALTAAGKLDLSKSVTARYPLKEANAALQRLASKEGGVTRLVVEPNA